MNVHHARKLARRRLRIGDYHGLPRENGQNRQESRCFRLLFSSAIIGAPLSGFSISVLNLPRFSPRRNLHQRGNLTKHSFIGCWFCTVAIFLSSAAAQTTLPATAPSTQPAGFSLLGANQDTPHGAVEVSLIALFLRDADATRSIYVASNDIEQRMIDAMVAQDQVQHDIATQEKKLFPADYVDPQARLRDELVHIIFPPVAQSRQTITGDTAICTYQINGQSQQRELVKYHGKWCVPFAEAFFPDAPPNVTRQAGWQAHEQQILAPELQGIHARIKALNQSLADLRAGKYLSLDEADDAITAAQQEAIAALAAQTQPAESP